MLPLVSVIITTYNRPSNILERAIKSVKAQDYDNIELIVVNDSPQYQNRDMIERVIEKYSIKEYFVNDRSCGAGYSRNRGVSHSKGEYIAFLDDDDEWLYNKTSTMMRFFDSNNIAMVYCDLIVCNSHGESVLRMGHFQQKDITRNLLVHNYIGGFSSPILRADVLREVGGMDETLPSSQDSDLWRRISLKHKIVYCPEPLIKYYISDTSITSNPESRFNGTLLLLKKYEYLYNINPGIRYKHLNRCVRNYVTNGWFKYSFTLYDMFYKNNIRCIQYYLIFFYSFIKRLIKLVIK